jgi:hypothetical protein
VNGPTGSLALDVACPWCGQPADAVCRTASGKDRPFGQEHRLRWDALHAAYARPRRYVLKKDDEQSGLTAGDVLVCEPYFLDPEKLTVMFRETDGLDPERNVYRAEVTRVRGVAGVITDPEVLRESARRARAGAEMVARAYGVIL